MHAASVAGQLYFQLPSIDKDIYSARPTNGLPHKQHVQDAQIG